MKIINTTKENLELALKETNKKYADNVQWNRFDTANGKGTSFNVTFRVKDSHAPGHRLGFIFDNRPQRHLINACWHVHGDFFDNLLALSPDAVIHAGQLTITKDGGNWQDRNIGSQMYPLYYSEACDCQ